MKNIKFVSVITLALPLIWTPVAHGQAMIEILNTGMSETPMFNLTATTPNPDFPDLTPYEIDLADIYESIFGMPSPNELPKGLFMENEEMFAMGIGNDGGGFDTFQEFQFLVTGDFWRTRANITLNPATAVIFDPNDEIVMDGFVQHFGKSSADGIPHPGDTAAGPMISYSMTANAGNKVPTPPTQSVASLFASSANHPENEDHTDVVLGALGGAVVSTSGGVDFFDDITFWFGGISGFHVVPEPSTFFLFGSSLFASVFLRKKKWK